MNRGLLLAGAAGLVLALACLIWPARRSGRPHAHAPGTAAADASSPQALRPRRKTLQALRLLPFTPDQIDRAAQIAQAFVAAYETHSYSQPPATYISGLAPMMAPSLRTVLERTAHDPATLLQRHRAHETSVATARAEAIRALGPTSITFVIAATAHITTTYATTRETAHYALTLIPAEDGGWRVYDLELASTGQTGDADGTP